MRLRGGHLALVCAAILGLPSRALAQRIDQYLTPDFAGLETEPGVTVTSRLHPDYDYLGIRAGDFVIRPELTQSLGYESNILAKQPAHGGAVTETEASVSAASDWSRDSLGASLQVDNNDYPGTPGQSYTDWQAQLQGSLDIGRGGLQGSYTHQTLYQTERDLDVPQLAHPIAYRIDTGTAAYLFQFSRLSITPAITLSDYGFDNGEVDGALYDQSYRDRVVVAPGITAAYAYAPRRSLVLVVNDADASYQNPQPGQPSRDYNDVTALAGVAYDTGGPIALRALVGYESRSFRAPQYRTIAAPIAELAATWTPSGLTTLTADLSRTIADSAAETTTGFTETTASVAVDHEYLRNVRLHGQLGLTDDDYPDGQGSQQFYSADAGLTWLLNRHLRLAADYQFTTRQSGSEPGDAAPVAAGAAILGKSYRDHRIVLQIEIGF